MSSLNHNYNTVFPNPFKLSEEKSDAEFKFFEEERDQEKLEKDLEEFEKAGDYDDPGCHMLYSLTLFPYMHELTHLKSSYLVNKLTNILKNGGDILTLATKIREAIRLTNLNTCYDRTQSPRILQIFDKITYFINQIRDYYAKSRKIDGFEYRKQICDMRYLTDYTVANIKETAFYSFTDNTMDHNMSNQFVDNIIFGKKCNVSHLAREHYKIVTQRDLYFAINSIYSLVYCLNPKIYLQTFMKDSIHPFDYFQSSKKKEGYANFDISGVRVKQLHEVLNNGFRPIHEFIKITMEKAVDVILIPDNERNIDVEQKTNKLLFNDWKKINMTIYDFCYDNFRKLSREYTILDIENARYETLRGKLIDIIAQIGKEETKIKDAIEDGNGERFKNRRYDPLYFGYITAFMDSLVYNLKESIRFIELINAEFAAN